MTPSEASDLEMADHLTDTADKIRSEQTKKQTDQVWKEGYILAALLPLRPFYSSHDVVKAQILTPAGLSPRSLFPAVACKGNFIIELWGLRVVNHPSEASQWVREADSGPPAWSLPLTPRSWHDAPLPNQGSADGAKEENMVRERSPRPVWAIQHGPVSK